MKKLLLSVIFLLISGMSEPVQATNDQVCFADAYGVSRHSPGSYPSYTYLMPGHKNQKCWFPATKDDKKWHLEKVYQKSAETKVVKVSNDVKVVAIRSMPLPEDLKVIISGTVKDQP